MISLKRKAWTAVITLALMVAVVTAFVSTGAAANLTGGNYTYVIAGEEVTFQFDPVSRKEGLLLPLEVFQHLGLTVDKPLEKSFQVTRGEITAVLTLGETNITVNDVKDTVAVAPMRLNGRLFLPADLMQQFGVEFSQDGNYIMLKNYVDSIPEIVEMTAAQYNSAKALRWVQGTVKADSGIFLSAEFTLLSPELVAASQLEVKPGMRAKLHGLLQDSTLVLVKLSNSAFKGGSLNTNGLTLVDFEQKQYDVVSVLDIGDGMVNAKLSPGARRTGILVFKQLKSEEGPVSVYYDPNGAVLGTMQLR